MLEPITFTRTESREFLKWVLSTTLDEQMMLKAWRLYRARTKAPLFVLRIPEWGTIAKQAGLNFAAAIAWHERGHPPREIVAWTGLTRNSVQRYLHRWRNMSQEERGEWARELKVAMENVDGRIEEMRADQNLMKRAGRSVDPD